MKLIICISGDGGGCYGPGGAYRLLCQMFDPQEYHVLTFNTIPRTIVKNCYYICNQIIKSRELYDKFFLVGWSLGTAVCVNIACMLKYMPSPIFIDSMIMVSPIVHRMENFGKLDIPIGYIHGKLDQIASYQNSIALYNATPSFKTIHIFEQYDHLFDGHGTDVAIKICNMLINFDHRYDQD
jgi:alpha/beta superfamily hydrolase